MHRGKLSFAAFVVSPIVTILQYMMTDIYGEYTLNTVCALCNSYKTWARDVHAKLEGCRPDSTGIYIRQVRSAHEIYTTMVHTTTYNHDCREVIMNTS